MPRRWPRPSNPGPRARWRAKAPAPRAWAPESFAGANPGRPTATVPTPALYPSYSAPSPLSLLPVLQLYIPDSSRRICRFHLGFGLGRSCVASDEPQGPTLGFPLKCVFKPLQPPARSLSPRTRKPPTSRSGGRRRTSQDELVTGWQQSRRPWRQEPQPPKVRRNSPPASSTPSKSPSPAPKGGIGTLGIGTLPAGRNGRLQISRTPGPGGPSITVASNSPIRDTRARDTNSQIPSHRRHGDTGKPGRPNRGAWKHGPRTTGKRAVRTQNGSVTPDLGASATTLGKPASCPATETPGEEKSSTLPYGKSRTYCHTAFVYGSLILQRQFKEGCTRMPGGQLDVSRESG